MSFPHSTAMLPFGSVTTYELCNCMRFGLMKKRVLPLPEPPINHIQRSSKSDVYKRQVMRPCRNRNPTNRYSRYRFQRFVPSRTTPSRWRTTRCLWCLDKRRLWNSWQKNVWDPRGLKQRLWSFLWRNRLPGWNCKSTMTVKTMMMNMMSHS